MSSKRRKAESTTDIGNRLEDLVADYLRKDVESGAYGIPSKCQIHQKKAYWSSARNADIVVDVSIEVFHPGATERSLLWVVECKNEGRPAEVGDVETLDARMNQIAGGATKGLLVSRAGFQAAAISFAKSKGIALMRWMPGGQFSWELRRERGVGHRYGTQLPERILRALAGGGPEAGLTPTPIMSTEGAYVASMAALLVDEPAREIGRARSLPNSVVPFLATEVIERRARVLLDGVDYQSGRVCMASILERIQATQGLVVREGAPHLVGRSPDLLASLKFDPFELVLYPHQGLPLSSRRFTLAHEIGHVALGHGDYLESETRREPDATLLPQIDHVDVARMEVQANMLAGALLLPKQPVISSARLLASRLGLLNKGYGMVYLDEQPANVRAWGILAGELAEEFDVSETVLRIRLREVGVLVEGGHLGPVPLGELLGRRRPGSGRLD